MHPPSVRQAPEKYPPLRGQKGLQGDSLIVKLCGILKKIRTADWNF
jgi:hypothetical protein